MLGITHEQSDNQASTRNSAGPQPYRFTDLSDEPRSVRSNDLTHLLCASSDSSDSSDRSLQIAGQLSPWSPWTLTDRTFDSYSQKPNLAEQQ